MLNNNLLFSLLLSIFVSCGFYLFTNKINENTEEKKNETLFLFGLLFIISFILKILSQNTSEKLPSGGNSLTHSSRPPF